MNYFVIKDFIDRDSLKLFKAGEKFACLDTSRAAVLKSRGYIADMEQPKEEAKEKPEKTAKAKTSSKRATTKKKA